MSVTTRRMQQRTYVCTIHTYTQPQTKALTGVEDDDDRDNGDDAQRLLGHCAMAGGDAVGVSLAPGNSFTIFVWA